MKKLLVAAVLLVLFACGKEKETHVISSDDEDTFIPAVPAVNYALYRIREGGLGHISIGMTVKESQQFIVGLEKKKINAHDFGHDGGGEAYLYSNGNEPVFALIADHKDTIIAIIAIDKSLTTAGGLHPKMKVKELMSHYPETIYFDAMMGLEYIPDNKNNWWFVFSSAAKPIADHGDPNKPSKPKYTDAICNWVTIKAAGKCSMLRNGEFTYKDANGKNVRVKFENDVCTEEHNNGAYILISKINWVSECEYENTLVMTTLPDFPFNPGTKMYVSIDRVEGNNFYFSAAVDGKLYKNMFTKL